MNFRIEYRNTVLVSIDKVLNCTHVLPVYQFHAWIYISPFNNSLNFEQIQSVFKKAAGPLWLMPPHGKPPNFLFFFLTVIVRP